jgi:hypothetical protein
MTSLLSGLELLGALDLLIEGSPPELPPNQMTWRGVRSELHAARELLRQGEVGKAIDRCRLFEDLLLGQPMFQRLGQIRTPIGLGHGLAADAYGALAMEGKPS